MTTPISISVGWHSEARAMALVDESRQVAVALASDHPVDIWHMPIFTVSLFEGGFEKVYQGTTVIHRYRLHVTESPVRISLRLHAGGGPRCAGTRLCRRGGRWGLIRPAVRSSAPPRANSPVAFRPSRRIFQRCRRQSTTL